MPPPRSPPQLDPRINLADLKSQIVKKLGLDRANQYFNCLQRFLSQKVGKSEFDGRCRAIFGRENIHLHNQFIRSVLKNACNGTAPPPPPPPPLPPRSVGKMCDGEKQSKPPYASNWSNGDVPPSPRKVRSSVRDRRIKDRPSPLGPCGKTLLQSGIHDELARNGSLENGMMNLCDLSRPVQHHHGIAERPEAQPSSSLPHSVKMRPAVQSSPYNGVSVHNSGFVYPTVSERDVDFVVNRNTSPLRAPLGIPFCSASIGGARSISPGACSSSFSSLVDNSELSDSETLRKRMQQIAGVEELDGVSLECANLLNNGLDSYLKRLIKSCIDIGRARSGHETTKYVNYKEQPQGKIVNGLCLGQHGQAQRNIGSFESVKDSGSSYPISLQDFKLAMELNPQQLGEDWPLLLEKICFRLYEK